MYDERIEQLISAALADGVLTEKEKKILFKRAQAQGIDLYEFEMVLDARLVELQKVEKEKAAKSALRSNKLGEVRKCPSCGEMLSLMDGVCPSCGHLFDVDVTDVKAVDDIDKLVQRLLRVKPNNKPVIYSFYIIVIGVSVLAAFADWRVESGEALWWLIPCCSLFAYPIYWLAAGEPMPGSLEAEAEGDILPSKFNMYYYEIQSKIKAAKNVYSKKSSVMQRLSDIEISAESCAKARKDRSRKIMMAGVIVAVIMVLVGVVIGVL